MTPNNGAVLQRAGLKNLDDTIHPTRTVKQPLGLRRNSVPVSAANFTLVSSVI